MVQIGSMIFRSECIAARRVTCAEAGEIAGNAAAVDRTAAVSANRALRIKFDIDFSRKGLGPTLRRAPPPLQETVPTGHAPARNAAPQDGRALRLYKTAPPSAAEVRPCR